MGRTASRLVSSLVALGSVVAGCSADQAKPAAEPSVTTSSVPGAATVASAASTPSTAASIGSAATGRQVLDRVALTEADVTGGVTFSLVPDGDKVHGQVTLDICGFAFTSETDRTDRLQNEAVNSADESMFDNENVLYRSADAARAALQEVRTAIARCPAGEFKSSTIEGEPPLKTSFQLTSESQLGGLAADHVAFAATSTAEDGQSESYGAIFQRRGRVLAAVYGDQVAPILPDARALASRLAALSPVEAGE